MLRESALQFSQTTGWKEFNSSQSEENISHDVNGWVIYLSDASLDVTQSDHQIFQACTGVVSKAEMEKLKYLSLAYMTEEFDDPENLNGNVEH